MQPVTMDELKLLVKELQDVVTEKDKRIAVLEQDKAILTRAVELAAVRATAEHYINKAKAE